MPKKHWSYYNDTEPFVTDWIRGLIRRNLIPDGEVDGRSIADVTGADLAGFRRVHVFAGLCGWPRALDLAGFPRDEEVWTGSCPCQPFSVIGKGGGEADERHLWPHFRRLIAERRPATVFGEQVAGGAGLKWLAGVRPDLEAMGYLLGAADLCAACVGEKARYEVRDDATGELVYRGAGVIGPPHIRQRIYWMAHNAGPRAGANQRGVRRLPERCRPASDSGAGFWREWDARRFSDGTTRRLKPGLEPLADGLPGRMGRLRAYGNSIVAPLAARFIIASRDALIDTLTPEPGAS